MVTAMQYGNKAKGGGAKFIALFGALFIPLFCYLGFWQLDRSQQKQQLIADFEQRNRVQQLVLLKISQMPTSESLQGKFHPGNLLAVG